MYLIVLVWLKEKELCVYLYFVCCWLIHLSNTSNGWTTGLLGIAEATKIDFDKADQVPKTVAPSDCFVSLYLFWAMEVGNCMIDVRDASCFRRRTSGHCALGKWDSATKVQHS